jgi:Uma2 family endonuclease
MTKTTRLPTTWSMKDVLRHLGGISAERVRVDPPPGRATVADVIRIQDRENRNFELIDGILVEKTVGAKESYLALRLGRFLGIFAEERGLGFVLGADGTLKILPGMVRIPDVCFISWTKLPRRQVPDEPVPDLVPDLAAEVLSKGNTRGEMARKLRDYFLAGVRLVWFIKPRDRTATVYTAPDRPTKLTESQSLDGGDVLPGFSLPLRQLFAEIGPSPAARRKKP